ncbi:SfnB family sulfur acquisition oxidoreductase [Serratia ficaria]|uniref:SfnB family sulfur acquisition oxidoreductase n=1 Tax=Serratia ficaria TaxID=61651 RepID=UPI00077C6C76|nr:SfnB family sulfur acquisition oxidoreductase [Serratia ficaria]MEE4482176.1 SfnB family sulfur acquisition oxidoreductase [Serratia ficaria]CAI0704310.1 putative acyl-CoA dehydrogenase [Serratia ficaria]CAI1013411.1 putative acyl-CoA dehydrogenase [Serratia ficaria]CAI1669613.1 putative acyl-CoA dehydrogenase [Serratia ficaria]CAI1750638.1 putative acyl-CoA dehydrogenase [Serratia ficaria]
MSTQVTPAQTAQRITSAEQALDTAHRLAEQFAPSSAERDSQRRLPVAELATLFASGLGAITVPREFGGPALSNGLLARIIAIISQADASIGQVPQNHFYALEVLRVQGSPQQQRRLYQEALAGVHFGNALAEFAGKAAHHRSTALYRQGDQWRLRGQKFYATGALYAGRIPTAALGEDGKERLVFLPRATPGLTITDDWSGFGQRTTGSGSVTFADCPVDEQDIVPFHSVFERPTPVGPLAQIMHAAIDQGIAKAAWQDMLQFVRNSSRPWIDAGVERASQDPLTLDRIGKISARIQAGDALLEAAGEAVDAAQRHSDEQSVALASIEVAKARAWTTEVALAAGNLLFELAGSRATLREHNLDRHWRNARTHTLHDPVRWKYPAIGNYLLNGVLPPRRGTL